VNISLLVRLTTILLLSSLVLAACGGDDDSDSSTSEATAPTATMTQSAAGQPTGVVETVESTPAFEGAPDGTTPETPAQAGEHPTEQPVEPTPDAEPTQIDQPAQNIRLTPEQLQEYRPNELGWIPLLQYHHFGPVPDELTRTPDQFRGDLQWLYDNNFYVINIRDYLRHHIDVPPGKRPVMLSFDDSAVSQFKLVETTSGQMMIDQDSAIGIMEVFFRDHPDFGRGGHFAILPDRAFSWPDAWDQQQYAQMKLEWLVDNGYELGNHTIDHANLGLIDNAEAQFQLAEAEILTRKYIPDARLEIVTLPYGGYPGGNDDSVFRGFHYEGEWFEYEAVLLVGANPAYSPVSTDYHRFWIPRIQAFDEELGRWQDFILENPDIMYVSDGNPDTVTIPNELNWALLDTLDESKLMDRELIRY
jgi:peptidoglycan/xylan/chitin deacetylase (PgdA/CDA1 family)